MATKCLPSVDDALGCTHRQRDLSAYSYGYFIPTKAQRSHGARWISCSVVLRESIHAYRATGAFVVPADRYPGVNALNRKAEAKCPAGTPPRR